WNFRPGDVGGVEKTQRIRAQAEALDVLTLALESLHRPVFAFARRWRHGANVIHAEGSHYFEDVVGIAMLRSQLEIGPLGRVFRHRPPRGSCGCRGHSARGQLKEVSSLHAHTPKNARSIRIKRRVILQTTLAHRHSVATLGNRPRVKWRQCIVQAPVISPGFLAAAGYVQNEAEDLPSNVFDRGLAAGYAA